MKKKVLAVVLAFVMGLGAAAAFAINMIPNTRTVHAASNHSVVIAETDTESQVFMACPRF